jgi:hypothetical protein
MTRHSLHDEIVSHIRSYEFIEDYKIWMKCKHVNVILQIHLNINILLIRYQKNTVIYAALNYNNYLYK